MQMSRELFTVNEYAEVFRILELTKGVYQDPAHHEEGEVYIHSLQTFVKASRESIDIDLLLAALLHDVGKANGSYGHEKHSIELLKDYSSVKTLWLIENHMRIWYYLLGQMRGWKKCTDLANHPWFGELCQLGRFDKLGRVKGWVPKIGPEEIVKILYKAAIQRWLGWEEWINGIGRINIMGKEKI